MLLNATIKQRPVAPYHSIFPLHFILYSIIYMRNILNYVGEVLQINLTCWADTSNNILV